ncbi:MAG: TIR domain-containing protein [Gammaproteobacteria bacterium]|nr:TIR domain-containing protein [Gammaproteobacteria bacterium]
MDKARIAPLIAAVTARGWTVWWDPEITPGQEFDDQIEAELDAAKAVLVVWTPNSVTSRWVRGEAREAADRGILVPVRFEQARLPMDVRAIHTTDLDGWGENPASPQAREFLQALGAMIARAPSHPGKGAGTAEAASGKPSPRFTICVLPFANMSGDPEQEYFSDGITEDIITDLSKVSALGIISRNSAFMYKGKHVDIPKVARELKVTHVLEGSVRKAGGRVRINAQLVDGETNNHLWAERYDRESSDIFALQDEISEAIVKALRLKLLPEEKKAIVRRGTDNAEAHNLYMMARQTYVAGQEYDARSAEAIVRLASRATEIDPGYAQAWALRAIGHLKLQEVQGGHSGEGMAAADRAMALDPNLAEAHAVKAQLLLAGGDAEAAASEVTRALELSPESYEVNRSAGRLNYQLHRYEDAVRFYEKAAGLTDADLNSASMLISSYTALNDTAGMRRAAQIALKRAEAVLSHDPNNSMVAGYSAYALAALGEGDRAKARMERALLIDPENFNMRYNFACALCTYLKDREAALDMLGPVFDSITETFLSYVKVDPDLDMLRGEPRYKAMLKNVEDRLAAEGKA